MQSIDAFLAQWAAAERTGDTQALDALLTDDFVGVGPLGFTLPKSAWLARHADGGLRYDRFDLNDVQPRVHGNVAIVIARLTQDGFAHGHPVPEAARATLVLTDDGGWRLAQVHLSFIAGTRGAPPTPTVPDQEPTR